MISYKNTKKKHSHRFIPTSRDQKSVNLCLRTEVLHPAERDFSTQVWLKFFWVSSYHDLITDVTQNGKEQPSFPHVFSGNL